MRGSGYMCPSYVTLPVRGSGIVLRTASRPRPGVFKDKASAFEGQ